jgi:hypothetical protein
MKANPGTLQSLTELDLKENAVWLARNPGTDEIQVVPVKRTPCTDFSGILFGSRVQLANGQKYWSLIGNIVPDNPTLTEHYVSVSLLQNSSH